MEKKNDLYREKECADFLKTKHIDVFLKDVKKKYQSYGSFTGTIKTKECERDALTSIVGFRALSSLRVNSFVEALEKSRFKETDFLRVLEIYFNETICTNRKIKEDKELKSLQKLEKYTDILNGYGLKEYGIWLEEVFKKRNNIYRLLMKQEDNVLIDNIAKGLKMIKENNDYLPIAVFASNVSGNPHYFDKDLDGDKLLISALSFMEDMPYPSSNIERKRLLSLYNLSGDEIAGNVALFQVDINLKEGKHEGADYTYRLNQPFVCSMSNLRDAISLSSKNRKVYIVENEMVFSYLQKNMNNKGVGLICTSGQLSATARQVINLLVKGKSVIYYGGDIDPEGISIANSVKKMSKNVNYWHFDEYSYAKGLSLEKINDRRLAILGGIDDDSLQSLIKNLKLVKKAAYQENILDLYLNDLKEDA